MSWSLIEWEAEAERLGGRFWQPSAGRRIARAYFGGTTYVEVDLLLDRDEINELIAPRISLPRNAINEEARTAANALAKWRPNAVDKTHTQAPEAAQSQPVSEPIPKGRARRGWLWILLLAAIAGSVGLQYLSK